MGKLVTVVLSGGSGTRLWPVSRDGHPKPFISLPDGESLIKKTYDRAKSLGDAVVTVTNRDYYFLSKNEQKNAEVDGFFLLEPLSKNTGPAIALAAKYIEKEYGPETIMVVLAADHLIDQSGFEDTLPEAVKIAESGFLVTFGIVPTSAMCGYGYIKKGETLGQGNKVSCFVEKPDAKKAKEYFGSGEYLWNSGVFCFGVGKFLAELKVCAQSLDSGVAELWDNCNISLDGKTIEFCEELYKKLPNISLDYAVLEKSKNVAVVPSRFEWNDIGTWDTFKDLIQPDRNGNRISGDGLLIDSKNTFIYSEGRVVAGLGLSDVFVIDTPDALLVASANTAQDVRKVVESLKEKNKIEIVHKTVIRPWGRYTILDESNYYKIKRIEVNPGGRLSLQSHRFRNEHWIVVEGIARVTNGLEVADIKQNESTYIKSGSMHRLENPTNEMCILIEVQTGTYLGEDDIQRFDDEYGRAITILG